MLKNKLIVCAFERVSITRSLIPVGIHDRSMTAPILCFGPQLTA